MDDVLTGYRTYLSRLPLSSHTKRAYVARVNGFLEWLQGSTAALTDCRERDFVVRDYKTFLLQSGRSSATVNAVLSALDNFYLYLGIGGAKVRRQDLPQQAPRALGPEEQRRLLKVVAHSRSARDRTLVMIMLHCGLRISELAALDVGDVFVTARRGELVVRCGKGGRQRRIPMNADLREAMMAYMGAPQDPQAPLFRSQRGTRMSVNAIAHLMRQFARDAGVEMTAHRLRHTALTRLVRSGVDIVTVAEVAGHARLETTRRYCLPTADVKIAAMEKLNYSS